jgi:hypothetical protein
MGPVETLFALTRSALSLYCPIPVVIEQQQIHAFRSGPTQSGVFVVAGLVTRGGVLRVYFVWNEMIAATMSIGL